LWRLCRRGSLAAGIAVVALLRHGVLHGDGLLLLHLLLLLLLLLLLVLGLLLLLLVCMGGRLLLGVLHGDCLLGITCLLLLLGHGLLLLHLLAEMWGKRNVLLRHVSGLLQRGNLLGIHIGHLVLEAHPPHAILLGEHLLLLLLLLSL